MYKELKEFKAPENISLRNRRPSVFLAGSIEMGNAPDWQPAIAAYLLSKGFNVFNPRRDDWDSSWKQEFTDPQFFQQVVWELDALEEANHIVMYLAPDTISPISLLELGLFARSGKLHVVCPPEFKRRGNVEIVCAKYGVPMYEKIEDVNLKWAL